MRIIYRGTPPTFKSQGKTFVRDSDQADREVVVSDEWWDNLSERSKRYFEVISLEDNNSEEILSQVEDEIPVFPAKGFRTKKDVQIFAEKHLEAKPRSNEYKRLFDTKFALKTLQENALNKYVKIYGTPDWLKTEKELAQEEDVRRSKRETILIKPKKGVKIDSSISNQHLKKRKVAV